jgi:hypothetical protein
MNTGVGMVQGMGNAVQNNQDGNILQNMMGAVTDVAKTTVQAGTTAVGGVVTAGTQTVGGMVETGK